MTPVEGCFLVDVHGLAFGHQPHISIHKALLVKLLLQCAGVFGESPAAIIALEALRSMILAETVVVAHAAMKAATLLFQQG